MQLCKSLISTTWKVEIRESWVSPDKKKLATRHRWLTSVIPANLGSRDRRI
jgi:hypothetical protein